MKNIYALLTMVVMAIAPVFAQDYKTNYSADDLSAHGSRYPGSVILDSPEHGQQTINWASGTKHALYTDATDHELTVTAGEEVQLLVNYTGSWMSAYVYIDLNDDKQFGYDVDEVNHCYKEGSELVSWSFYSFDPEVSEDPGWNSKGEQLTGSARSTVNCPKFTAPTEAGTYRCRVKVDWNSIDPAGSVTGHKGGAMDANGGAIIDFMLKVEAAFEPVTIHFNQASGEWTASNANKTWAASWKSTATDPYLTVSCANNNMAYNGNGDPKLYSGTVTPRACPYTIAVQEGYVIVGYSFDTAIIDGQWTSITPEGGEEVVTPGHVEVTGINKQATTFTLSTHADNKGVQLSNFTVTITKAASNANKQVIFVYDKTAEHNVTYRIPSIASIATGTHAGRIVAFTDYRPGGADVGLAEVDIHCRYSDDFGKTWGEEITIVDGLGNATPDNRHFSFGDPVSIADRETGRLLMVSCSGRVSYQNASRTNHQGVEVFWSEDGGQTWSEPVDVSEQLYVALPTVPSMFVGSGGFVQSKFVKKGDYYRVYGGILCRENGKNYIIYTDDFGQTWQVLGGASAHSLTGGDEAKAEELPDGSVLQSSRTNGGRIFNIWRWDDDTYTTGHWETQATSGGANNGILAGNNSTNGEILIVPAKRTEDGKSVYLAMQSIPFGSGRANVGIYYKELAEPSDFASPAVFAANWTKGMQVSFKGSAYSAMVLQEDGNIGFLVEEETYGFGFSQVYHNLSYEDITDGAYTFIAESDPDFDRSAFNIKRGTVTYNLMWNGELQTSVAVSTYYGEELPQPQDLPAFTEATGIPALTMSEAINGQTFDVEVVWSADAPVQLSDALLTTHYYLYMREGQYLSDDADKDYIDLTKTTYEKTANYMWRFEGNPFTGLQIYTYDGKILASASPEGDGNTGMNTHPRAYAIDEVPEGMTTDWSLKTSNHYEGGFFIFNVANGYALNYRNPYLAYWTGGYDAGSTFRAIEVPEDELPEVVSPETPAELTLSYVLNETKTSATVTVEDMVEVEESIVVYFLNDNEEVDGMLEDSNTFTVAPTNAPEDVKVTVRQYDVEMTNILAEGEITINFPEPAADPVLLFSVTGNVGQYPEDFGFENSFPKINNVLVNVYDSYLYIHSWAGVEGYDLKVFYTSQTYDTTIGEITEHTITNIVPVVDGEEQQAQVIDEGDDCFAYVVPTGREDFNAALDPGNATISDLYFDMLLDADNGYIDLYVEDTYGYYLAWGVWDAITSVNADTANATIYNIAGQKMNRLHRGINIVGGKKVVVK